MKRFQHVPKCGFADFHVFFMNITVKTVHICRFTDRYYLWNDRFSVLSRKFCPFKGFLDLSSFDLKRAKWAFCTCEMPEGMPEQSSESVSLLFTYGFSHDTAHIYKDLSVD